MSEDIHNTISAADNPVVYTKKGSRPGPSVLITAGVHGDEYEPMIAAHSLLAVLDQKLLKGKVTIVPIANPPAFRANHRVGGDGLDLARVCPGNQYGRPTEQIAWAISRRIRNTDYYIDMHTGGSLFDIFPLAGYMLHNNHDILTTQQNMAAAFGLPVIWGTDASLNGRTLSVARDAAVPAIYTEFGGAGLTRKKISDAYVQGCLNVLAMLEMVEKDFTDKTENRYWVEDHTREVGYLQDKMQSPADGHFVADIIVGQIISKGDVWGRVIDLTSGSEEIVKGNAQGLVLFVRTKSRVKKGDALGNILPITKPGKIQIDEN